MRDDASLFHVDVVLTVIHSHIVADSETKRNQKVLNYQSTSRKQNNNNTQQIIKNKYYVDLDY